MAGSATAAKSKITLKGSAEIVAEFFGMNLDLSYVKYLDCVLIFSSSFDRFRNKQVCITSVLTLDTFTIIVEPNRSLCCVQILFIDLNSFSKQQHDDYPYLFTSPLSIHD